MKAIEEAIFKVVRDVLEKHNGHRANAAAELGCTVKTIYNYCVKWPELNKYVKNHLRLDKQGNKKWQRYSSEEMVNEAKKKLDGGG